MTTETPGARAAWDAIASRFDQFTTPVTMALGGELVHRLGVSRGTRFLDVAAGSGALAIPAARRGAEVLAVDIAPTMLERLRARAAAEGLTNVEALRWTPARSTSPTAISTWRRRSTACRCYPISAGP